MTITAGLGYTYQPFPGDQLQPLTLFPWVGTNVAVSTLSNDLSPVVMTRIVNGLDAAYDVYALITGRVPTPYVLYEGRLSLAELPDNPSYTFAEHGYLGFTGIEFQSTYFKELYNDATVGTFDQAPFYELGRNFWFYQDQLGAVDPFVTGFAIANRFVSMEVAGLSGGPFGALPFAVLKSEVTDGLFATYLSGNTYTLANTLGSGTPVASTHNWSVADLAGSFFYQVYENSSLAAYARFYADLANGPDATTANQAYSNFIAAASEATGTDFSFLLKPAGTTFQMGSAAADQITGTGSALVFGLAGNDVLTASAGGSRLFGGSGNDTLTGLAGSDELVGGLGNDTLNGGAGDDRLNGGAGGDRMTGGAGNDSYFIDAPQDRAIEAANGGIDTVYCPVTIFLGANLENLTLTGTANAKGYGNDLNNVLQGNDADNYLRGNGGADTMIGGKGDDIYVVTETGDRVIEGAAGGADLVVTGINLSLFDNVENLMLAGGARSGVGNGLDNKIVGSGGNDSLVGGDGSDKLYGMTGNDIISGGNGSDRLAGGVGHDTLTGGAGADTFYFATGDIGLTPDYVIDFTRGDGDKIDLTAFDAVAGTAAVDAFRFVGQSAFSHRAGELRYSYGGGNTFIDVDTNGDGQRDGTIRLTGQIALGAADFRFAGTGSSAASLDHLPASAAADFSVGATDAFPLSHGLPDFL